MFCHTARLANVGNSSLQIIQSIGKPDPNNADNFISPIDIVQFGQNIINARPSHALNLLVSLELCGRLAFLVSWPRSRLSLLLN